uniref:Uncharacterized protein n=1 Tax=Anguilla anguilla TaxID=7936 RepID=A0A0E9RR18_ANGAN
MQCPIHQQGVLEGSDCQLHVAQWSYRPQTALPQSGFNQAVGVHPNTTACYLKRISHPAAPLCHFICKKT